MMQSIIISRFTFYVLRSTYNVKRKTYNEEISHGPTELARG